MRCDRMRPHVGRVLGGRDARIGSHSRAYYRSPSGAPEQIEFRSQRCGSREGGLVRLLESRSSSRGDLLNTNDPDVRQNLRGQPTHVRGVGCKDGDRAYCSLGCLADAGVDHRDASLFPELHSSIGGVAIEDHVSGPADAVEHGRARCAAVPPRFDPDRHWHDDRQGLASPSAALVGDFDEGQGSPMFSVVDVGEHLDRLVVQDERRRWCAHALAFEPRPAAYTNTSSAVAPGRRAVTSSTARRSSAG